MTVYLGEQGLLEIRRAGIGEGALASMLNPNDVNVTRRRFSFDFEPEALITGDLVEIYTEDGSTLELVAGHSFPDGRWYIHVDNTGGVRLYDSFADALNGGIDTALALVAPTRDIPISVRTRDSLYRCTAQMRSWQMTTSREAVDITTLGEEHRRQYGAGLISGQGSLACMWDYKREMCDPFKSDERIEEPHYYAQLVLRVKQGSEFDGRFFINHSPDDRWVWWEATCVVTNVALSFNPGQVIDAQVEFVTTGPIHLRIGEPPGYLLQEDADLLLLEDRSGAIELEEPL